MSSSRNPYSHLPDRAFWDRAVAGVPPFALDPTVETPFVIQRNDAVATAGSCFAEHLSRNLQALGFHHFVAEQEPEGNAWFSARYGNLYTARQLVRLFDRAYGAFQPSLSYWRAGPDQFVDPFRPRIRTGGFASVEAVEADRRQHLACVRRLFENLDVLIFTLGLTEAWEWKEDGAVLPLAPGVAGGEWEPSLYVFRNYSCAEVADDLLAFVDRLRSVNPGARVILTVSPVPLRATYEPKHVLVSTCLSKSILRVAAESCCAARPKVAYFPAYEIVTGPHARGTYYLDDLRTVSEFGVDHVMRVFCAHYLANGEQQASSAVPDEIFRSELAAMQAVICDEDAFDDVAPDTPPARFGE